MTYHTIERDGKTIAEFVYESDRDAVIGFLAEVHENAKFVAGKQSHECDRLKLMNQAFGTIFVALTSTEPVSAITDTVRIRAEDWTRLMEAWNIACDATREDDISTQESNRIWSAASKAMISYAIEGRRLSDKNYHRAETLESGLINLLHWAKEILGDKPEPEAVKRARKQLNFIPEY